MAISPTLSLFILRHRLPLLTAMDNHRLALFVFLSLSLNGAAIGKTISASTEEQSTLSKSDLRSKEKRILATDLNAAESKLFVGHIPDIEDVGVFHPIPVPSNFEAYDVDPSDGKISLSELMKVTKAEENVGDSFFAADKNADGEISRSEFAEAPWWLEVDKGDGISNLVESSVDDVDATEDRLPSEESLSWNYILNGNLPSQEDRQMNSVEDQTFHGLPQMDGMSEVNSDGKRMTIDFGDVFDGGEDKVIMSDEDLKKLNEQLMKMR